MWWLESRTSQGESWKLMTLLFTRSPFSLPSICQISCALQLICWSILVAAWVEMHSLPALLQTTLQPSQARRLLCWSIGECQTHSISPCVSGTMFVCRWTGVGVGVCLHVYMIGLLVFLLPRLVWVSESVCVCVCSCVCACICKKNKLMPIKLWLLMVQLVAETTQCLCGRCIYV